jgi:hypothetical protein
MSEETDLIIPGHDLRSLRERINSGLDFTDPKKIVALYFAIKFAQGLVKEVNAAFEAGVIERIKESGSFKEESLVFTIKTDKSAPKCRDAKAAHERLFEVFGGDLGMVSQCLSSGAWKYGEVRALLVSIFPEKDAEKIFNELFDTAEKEKLIVTNEAEEPRLAVIDTRFIPKKVVAKTV